jgi:nicotinate-nucleotide pyrophosphorylase (carboxylating)
MDLKEFIEKALQEDIGTGDHTSLSCFGENETGAAKMLVKDSGVLAGVSVAGKIFMEVDASLTFKKYFDDSDVVKHGDVAFEISGSIQSILKSERLVLNMMQRMSGVATETAKYVECVKPYKTKILDTRKTTPLFREFEKEAVRIGGGMNHRMGLYDMIMIKDNHIDLAGGVANAIQKVKNYLIKKNLNLEIEIEARSIDEIKEIIKAGGVHRIMLDNFKIEKMKAAVALINYQYKTEASGGINLENVKEYAATGVDFISIGSLTHSYKNFDLSLEAI